MKYKFSLITFLAFLVLLTGCMPEQSFRNQAPTVANNQVGGTTGTNGSGTSQATTLPEATNFLQLNNNKFMTTLSLFSDYADSFIIRGNQINDYLKIYIQNNPKSLCLIGYYPDATGNDARKVVVMAARIRNYFNSSLGAREYFLQVEVANQSANTNDCLTVSLNNALQNEFATSTYAYKIDQICPSCNSNILSTGLRIFDSAGVENTNINLSYLRISLLPALGSSTGSANFTTCNTDATCTANGFNCCVQGQCVNHGEIKAGVDQTSNDYTVAVQQILARPELIANYTEFFYVCPLMVPTNPNNNQMDPSVDPVQQAANLFIELQDLYNCLNPVIDEFSICTKSYNNVSQLVNSNGGSYVFSAAADDITFSSINSSLTYNNITGLEYAGINIYKAQLWPEDTLISLNPTRGTIGSVNDNFTQGQAVNFTMPLPVNAINDTLKVRYRVDGTCERVGSTISKCTKYYKQGQVSTPPRSSDHPSGQSFAIPSYANTSYNVIVEVGGVKVSPGLETWSLVGNNVVFNATTNPIFNNQEVILTYFVTANTDLLMSSKEQAQAAVDNHCACGTGITCNLKPIYTTVAGNSSLTSYECLYPQPDLPAPPLQQTVFMSARTVAHKYYDSNGVYYKFGDFGSNSKQECAVSAGNESNCTLFQYSNDDVTKPNNVTSYIGFSEIFGSFNTSEKSPMPATEINIVKGRYYDVFTDEGVFSTCLTCGTDYYTNMQKIFPDNFLHKGGGYWPNMVESRRLFNQSVFNADDMRFGRACFVPPTMLPWTHAQADNITTQRRNRLKAQHFLFANGLNKDWYGFDYGSVIGSFDGVQWFSIGNQRRIQAKSNRLYLAVNAYFGDVTAANSFQITISETSNVANSGSSVTHDTQSDGAKCQRAHYCVNDNDCITQLGYDYTCQNVSALTTPWPQFDSNGNEVTGSVNLSLLSLAGGSNGQVKRCVYRGRGALCEQNAHAVNALTSYAKTDQTAFHVCSPNTYCESLDQSKFNTRISRYATSAADQNNKTYITQKTDTFGLGTRILGRPLRFYGDQAPPTGVRAHLNSLDVKALCIPGKAPMAATTTANINGVLSRNATADKILDIGKTYSSNVSQDPAYLSACPATDDTGTFTHLNNQDLDNNATHARFAITQNMSTNSMLLNSFNNLGLFNDNASLVTTRGYHKNTCLRAPGAKCFSDFDCAPNNFVSGKIKTVTNFLNEITVPEQNFWKEDLVCGNSQSRYIGSTNNQNPFYELFEHRCCREIGKNFTYYTQKHLDNTGIQVVDNNGDILIPGINQNLNDPRRYSRTHTVYDKLSTEPSTYPPLYTAWGQPATPMTINENNVRQYNTLHLNNARMCCTGHWVRKFATGTHGNNGGHRFSGSKQQNIDMAIFRPLNWFPNNNPPLIANGDTTPFACTLQNASTLDCEIKNIIEGSDDEQKYLKWMGKLELLGIPQVLIETNNTNVDNKYNMFKPVDADQAEYPLGVREPLDKTIKDNNGVDGKIDVIYNNGLTNLNMYSAASTNNFEIGSGKLKRVFSENEFGCCIPTGVEIDSTVVNDQCCTGQVTNQNGPTRCCLNDYTDLSVYTNRYVSSEGAYFNGQKISDNDIDPTTGYIKKEIVMQMAPNMCCSGKAMYGVAISEFYIPLIGQTMNQELRTRRWLFNRDLDALGERSGLFEQGVKYNDHVYCVPDSVSSGGSSGGSGSGGIGQ
jgi:hypothetical protein